MLEATPEQIAAYEAFERARDAWHAKHNPIVSRETEVKVAASIHTMKIWLRTHHILDGAV